MFKADAFLTVALCVILSQAFERTEVYAHRPVEFMEVVRVAAANTVEHSVSLQSGVDDSPIMTKLSGPELFAESVGCLKRPELTTKVYANWYRIVEPSPVEKQKVSVLDMVRGDNHTELVIGGAEFVLCPAQRVTSGPPVEIPHGLDYFKAYKIIDGADLQMPVAIQKSGNSSDRMIARAIYCCLSVEQWHHDEHIDSTHPRDCFVVYQLDTQSNVEKVSTIDQFGLNQLKGSESQWLCVSGALLNSQ